MAKDNSTLLYIVKNDGNKKDNKESSNSKKYHYPSTLLDQPYFITPATGKVELTLGVLSNSKFVSPALNLLKAMRADGHDVSAVFDEVQALYCLVRQQRALVEKIRDMAKDAMF